MKIQDVIADNRASFPLLKEFENKNIVEKKDNIVTDIVAIGTTQEILPYYKPPGDLKIFDDKERISAVPDEPVLERSYIGAQGFIDNQVELEPVFSWSDCCTVQNIFQETLKIVFGLSVGAGMCPIVSDQLYKLDEYDIHVNNLDVWTTISTLNTLCTYTLLGYMTMAHLLDSYKKYNRPLRKLLLQ